MKIEDFRKHQINRSCDKKYQDYHKYKPYLLRDFNNRCCYCNLSQDTITTYFQIDHFIPRRVFEGKRDELDCQYDNLILACPKCNLEKRDQYKGDIADFKIINELFYNPDEIDFNDIFYRNELGGIDSDDLKGREIIKLVKLYRPLHNLSWLVEKLESVCHKIDLKISLTDDEKRKDELKIILGKLSYIHLIKEKQLRAAYLQNK